MLFMLARLVKLGSTKLAADTCGDAARPADVRLGMICGIDVRLRVVVGPAAAPGMVWYRV